ncbi:RHS repeat-associated core domain-containing protein [Trinickia sp. NRRL B-1857]|uniref:RHS repeat-associated core domain-containing protein n=1 Tax=Trinickia sp. NRRL B-1857 TaxID=3162879 RepID=UPI003D28E26C
MVIRKCYESHSSGGKLLSERTFDYAKDSANLGRLTQTTHTHYPNDGSGKRYVTTRTFACEDDPVWIGSLRYTTAVLTHDGLKVSTWRSGSPFTGRVWRSTNAQGITTSFAYNALGYLTARTRAVGTAHESTMTSELVFTDGVDEAFQIITEDINGNKICGGFDAMGRCLYTAINSVDDAVEDANCKLGSQTFDQCGRLVSVTRTDCLLDPQESYCGTDVYQYDEWGRLCRIDESSGRWHSTSVDPIARTIVTTRGGKSQDAEVTTGQSVVTYSAGGKPLQMARYAAGADISKAKPYSVCTMSYDGLNRLAAATDALGGVTTYKYDPWGRRIETALPDGTVVKRHYRADSPAPQAVEITVTNSALQVAETSMGKRAFDGLNRIVSADTGRVSWKYQYDAPNADSQLMDVRATQVCAPDGTVRRYSYIRELHGALETVKAYPSQDGPVAITQTYAYDPKTGMLTGASETAVSTGSSSVQYTHHPSGRAKSEITSFDGKSRTMTHEQYSVGGKRYKYTHVDGATRITKHDSFGRVSEVSDDKMKVTLHYDPAGRLTEWQTFDLTSARKWRTALTLDDYGREVGRTVWQDGDAENSPTWTVTQIWNEANLCTSRTITHAGNTYRKETYGYDKRNRLTTWKSSVGSPTDRYGNILCAQTYTLDPFGNVTQVVSSFPKGESNIARFWYDGDPIVPYVLSAYSNTHASYPAHDGSRATVRYDGAGRTIDDGIGNTFDLYDELGRLQQTTNAVRESAQYRYDAHNRRYSQVTSGSTTYFYYLHGALVNLEQDASTTRMLCSPVGCPSQYIEQHSDGGVWLLVSDSQGSVLTASNGASSEDHAYSAYGEDHPKACAIQGGYTGQYRDPVLPGYMLGNGYRAYLPGLMRFAQPDAAAYSPFGKGGFNPYAYCGGDPINRFDPSGHFFLTHWIKSVDHGIGDFVGKHAPWLSTFFNAAGDRLYNFTTKGGILSFLPDKYNPVARLEKLAAPIIGSKFFGATPFGAAIQGAGWLTNTAVGFLHTTTGLSTSWSTLAVLGAESFAGDGVGDLFSGTGAVGEVGDVGSLGEMGGIDAAGTEFPTMEYTHSSGPIGPDTENVLPTKEAPSFPETAPFNIVRDDLDAAAAQLGRRGIYDEDTPFNRSLDDQFDRIRHWQDPTPSAELFHVIRRNIVMVDDQGVILPLWDVERTRVITWIAENRREWGLPNEFVPAPAPAPAP